MNSLEKYRIQMDNIDNRILKLLSARLKISKKIGEFKKANKIKIIDKKREKIIFKNIFKECSCLNLNKEFIKDVYTIVIKNSRKNQK